VEGDELEALKGIGSKWPIVRQVVVEVHDLHGRLAAVMALLEGKGFHVEVAMQQTEVR
jgi:hypothetical protein